MAEGAAVKVRVGEASIGAVKVGEEFRFDEMDVAEGDPVTIEAYEFGGYVSGPSTITIAPVGRDGLLNRHFEVVIWRPDRFDSRARVQTTSWGALHDEDVDKVAILYALAASIARAIEAGIDDLPVDLVEEER